MKQQLPYLASWQLLSSLQGEDKGYQAGYKTGYESGLRKGGSGYSLRKPTYQEIEGFLAQDTISSKTYMTRRIHNAHIEPAHRHTTMVASVSESCWPRSGVPGMVSKYR